MNWLSVMWIPLAGLAFIAVSEGQEIKANIPPQLRECYNDSIITTRDNLLPFTLSTFLSLIRKLEDTYTPDMRILASAISHRFRFDGIVRKPELSWSEDVIPYSPIGSEFPLYKVLFDKLIPKTQNIPNDTLNYMTYKERCTLHLMLSLAVDTADRNDNSDSCAKISKYSSGKWASGGGFRFPRDTRKILNPDAEVFDPEVGPGDVGSESGVHSGNFQQVLYQQESQCPLESGVIYQRYGTVTPGIVLAGLATGLQQENVNVRSLMMLSPRRGGLGGGGYMRPAQPAYDFSSTRQRVTFGAAQPGYQPGVYQPGGGGYQSPGYQPGVYQPQPGGGGSYGGGAGGYPGSGHGSGNNIDNRYAATLSGLLAQMGLLLGPAMETGYTGGFKVGMSGGWNDTAIPKYYFIRDYIKDALTDPEVRGAFDGLLLSKEIRKWSGTGSLKLSQVLGMYYSDHGLFGTSVKACARKENVDEFNQQSTDIKENAFGFAKVLLDNTPGSATISEEGIYKYVSMATDDALQYIGTTFNERCANDASSRSQTSLPTSPSVDLHLVVDTSYDFRDISKIITYLADNMEVNKYASNFSVLNGKDGKVLIESAQSVLEVYSNLTINKYASMTRGFDLDALLSAIRVRFQAKLLSDQYLNSGGGNPRVVLLLPQTSAAINNKNDLINKLRNIKTKVPDVKFIFLTTGTKDKYVDFVDDKDKDIFIINIFNQIDTTLDPVIKRISTIPKRLINPSCGPYWTGSWYNTMTVKGYLERPEVHFYRVHPNYFYTDTNARITFKNEDSKQSITVCKSRKPIESLTNQTQGSGGQQECKQLSPGGGSTYYYLSSNDCGTSTASGCDPYYFSVSTDRGGNDVLSSQFLSCTDVDCKYPDMLRYSVEHQGLTCYSSSVSLLPFPFLIAALLSLFLSSR